MKIKMRKTLFSITLALLGLLLSIPISASAFGPSVLYSPTGPCSRAYCVTYVKSVQLPGGKILASFEDNSQPSATQNFPVYSSMDDGQSWALTSSVPYTGPRSGWINWTNPFFYVLPQAIGGMPAGTILLAGIAAPPDKSATAVVLYKSNNEGQSWSYVSEVALGGGQWGSANPTPVWEPNLLVANDKLIVYYSDERDPANHSQKLVHQTSTNGVNWGPVVEDVALADPNLRPGMPVVVKMANGKYIMTYEIVNAPGLPNNFKISSNPESWNAADAGTTIDYGGHPFLIPLPNGRLAYNSGGSTDIRINADSGAGEWTPVKSNLPFGYSRMLQYVADTGRILVLSADGFWKSAPNTVYYGDVDLGYSAGPYYKLVNRKSGKALDVNGWDLKDGAKLIQWADHGGANQQWHVADAGGGYKTLINKHSGRALSIWATDTADGAEAVQWVENGGNDQKWTLVPAGSYYKIVNLNSGKLLCVLGSSTQDGAQVVQWSDTGTLDQQWQLVAVP